MPELPEVETVRRGLAYHLLNAEIVAAAVHVRKLRFPVQHKAIEAWAQGAVLASIRRRGKYLLLDNDRGGVLLLHLGMTGQMRLRPAGAPLEPHDHVVFTLGAGGSLRFNDARRFGWVDAMAAADEASHPRLRDLGLEPLANGGITGPALADLAVGTRRPVKTFLMDGNKLVGVGNIYASEALFRARIHPQRSVARISAVAWQRLAEAVIGTLEDALRSGGTTLRDFVQVGGEAGYFARALQVYGREGLPCRACGAAITRVVHGGRSTFYCKRCQR